MITCLIGMFANTCTLEICKINPSQRIKLEISSVNYISSPTCVNQPDLPLILVTD